MKEVCDEIVVVDSFSIDKTKSICLSNNVVFIENEFSGFVEQKNFAVQKASYDYVLSLDADEELSEELKSSLLLVKTKKDVDAISFSRLNNYCGKFIKHGGWYPDKAIRFWDRTKGQWSGNKVHEVVKMKQGARVELIPGDLIHYSIVSIEDHVNRVNKYARLSAEEMIENKKSINLFKLIFNPTLKFVKDYFFRAGFLDGYYGLIIASISAYSTYLKYRIGLKLKKAG